MGIESSKGTVNGMRKVKKQANLLRKVDRLFQTVDEVSKNYKEFKRIIEEKDDFLQPPEQEHTQSGPTNSKNTVNDCRKEYSVDFRLTGVSFGNCQEVIRGLRHKEEICLHRMPDNPHDANAIAVVKKLTGEQIGWIPRSYNAKLAKMLDKEADCRAELLSINHSRDGLYGVIVRVFTDEKLELAKTPEKKQAEAKNVIIKKKPGRSVAATLEMDDITEFIDDDDLFQDYLEN